MPAACRLIVRADAGRAADGKDVGSLVIVKPRNPDDGLAVAFLVDQQKSLPIVAAISVLPSALAAALLAAHFRKAVRQLVAGAAPGAGTVHTWLSIHRSDELGELADTFNPVAAGCRPPSAGTSHGWPRPRTNCARRFRCCPCRWKHCRTASAVPPRKPSR